MIWLRQEARALRWLREGQLWALLGLSLLLWSLAYQAPHRTHLAVGGDVASHTRRGDEPFLLGFNASEPVGDPAACLEWWQVATTPGSFAYRWAESNAAVVLPGLGGGRWLLTLGLSSGRADGSPVTATLRSGAWQQSLVLAAGMPRRYRLALPPPPGGDLLLQIAAPRIAGAGDFAQRNLALLVSEVTLSSLRGGLRAPPPLTLLALGTTLLLAVGTLRRLGIARRWALAAGLGLALLAAGLLLGEPRVGLTVFAPLLPPLLLACYGLAVAVTSASPLFVQARSSRLVSLLGLVVVAGFALRLGGLLHPHAVSSDLGLNTNNLRGLLRGELFIAEGLPAEAGGGLAPYPPGQYLVLAPLLLLLGTGGAGLDLATQGGNALLDSLVAGLLALALWPLGLRAAALGALLYLLPPPLLRSFSIGEFANIFGQATAMPLLLGVLARHWHARDLTAGRVAGAACLIALPLLSHLGVTISLAATLPCLLACLLLAGLPGRPQARALLLAGTTALAFVALCYYGAFGELLASRLATVAPSPVAQLAGPPQASACIPTAPAPPQAPLARLLLGLLRPTSVLYLPLLLIGLLGAGLWGGLRPGLPTVLLSWWLGTLGSLGLLLFARQGVRWEHFLYPALCLGGGIALARLWAYGRAGRLLVLALLATITWYGGALWYNQLRTYLH